MFEYVERGSMPDLRCKKCNKPDSKLIIPLSVYGFCNVCQEKFMPYLSEAIRKFIKSGNRKGTGKKSWATRRKNIK